MRVLSTIIHSLCYLLLISSIHAQNINNIAEQAPSNHTSNNNITSNKFQDQPEAMWDLQFAYSVEDSLYGTSSLTGVGYFDNEFWVSQWNSDSLFRFSANGQLLERFTILGIQGTRSMTWDGTYIWIGNATKTIYKVDPASKVVLGSVSVPENARFLTYDNSANGGAGGFWLGNWATDIYQVDMSGTVLTVIPSSTHGLSGMYGAAIDNESIGGPYLWIHWQNGNTSESEIAQLSLLQSGQQTGVSFDVTSIVGAPNGLAGGLFITETAALGEKTIGGLIQRTPITVFGLELDFVPIEYDVSVVSISSDHVYSLVPNEHFSLAVDAFVANIRNNGQSTLDSVQLKMWIELDEHIIYEDSTLFFNLQNLETESFTLTGFVPSIAGIYHVYAQTSIIGVADELPNNDRLFTSFEITDSTFARDDGILLPTAYTLNVNATEESEIAVIYETAVFDTVTSLEIELLNPINDVTSYAIVYSIDNGTNLPISELGRGGLVSFNDNKQIYTLPLGNGIELSPGRYAFAIHQPAGTNISLGQSSNIIRPQTHLYNIDGTWSVSGVATARMIRANFATRGWQLVHTEEAQLLDAAIRIFPNPANDYFRLSVNMKAPKDLEISIFNNIGQLQETRLIKNITSQYIDFDCSDYSNGVYNLRIYDGKTMINKKLIKVN